MPSTVVTILHLETDDGDAGLVKSWLEQAPFPIMLERVHDRPGFENRLEHVQFDLILADFHHPGIDGFTALAIARELQPHTPLLFVARSAGEEIAVEAMRRGAIDYVLKQRLERLPAAVERALAQARQQAGGTTGTDRASSILEKLTEAFVVLDARWNFTYMNAAFERMNGVRREDLLGRNHWEVYPASRGTRIELEYRRVAEEGVTVEFENYYEPWDRWFMVKAYPADGRGICVQIREVTEARRIAIDLARREEELRLITDAVPALIAYVDADEHYRFVNQGYEAWFGRSRQEIEGRHIRELLGEAMYQAIRPHITRVLAGERFDFETFAPYQFGQSRHIHADYVPRFEDGRVVGYFGLVTDITARKRAEAELRASEDRYRTLFSAMDEGFCILEMIFDAGGRPVDYRFLELNPAFEKHTGLRNAVGRTARELVPDLDAFWFETYGRVALTGESVRFVSEAKAMEARWFDVYAFRLGGSESRKVALFFNDISDRKRTEAELIDRELRYRLVADAANDAIWDWNLVTHQVVWNEGVRTHFGYTGDTVEPSAGWWLEHIHPEDVARVSRSIRDHIDQGGELWEAEYRFQRADGSYAAVLDRGRTVRDAAGAPIRMVGSMVDLTERKAAEAALRAAEERFAFVRQSSGVGFWYCDLPFDLLEWDERVKAHFYLPPDARVTIETFYERLHPDDREPTRQAIARSIEERIPYDVDYRTVDPETGAERWIRAIGRTFYTPDGTPKQFDGITLDITEQKRAQDELARLLADARRHAALLEQVASASRAVNAVLSAESVARIVTEEARAILGARLGATTFTTAGDCTQEIRAASTTDRHGFPASPQGQPTIDPELAVAACQDNRPIRVPRCQAGPDDCGRIAVPLLGHGGKNLGVIQLAGKEEGDFTADDESVLVQLAAIAAIGIENARLYERVREQDQRKDEFLATLAHELRNPLAPIRTGLALLKAARSPETMNRALATMERQVGHMVRLIDDLLDVSRITRGKVDLRKERTDVRAVLDAALEVSRPLIDAGHHTLEMNIPDTPLPIEVDTTRMAQVVSNLLNNAAKYTPEGGRIELGVHREGDEAVIRVRDNGVGIVPEMLPKVFEMFTQVGRSIERAQGGLGIGLALVHRLVEMHGGSSFAESEGLGRGSTFTVRLPIARESGLAPPRDAEPERSAVPTIPPRRILVVDDNQDAAETLAMLLRLAGHATSTAHTGPEALVEGRTFQPEIAFLDIGLPGMNGYEVAQRFRQDPQLKGAVLVALTGWGTDHDRRLANEAGFDHHLTKPVDASELEALLEALSR